MGGVGGGNRADLDGSGGGNGPQRSRPEPFQLRDKDHIAIIGNTLAERMQYDGWLETLMQARFPKHDLVIRNLGWSGDTVTTRMRSKNFGTPDEWLSGEPAPIGGYTENRFAGTNTKADVVFAFFGYNESYAGQDGLEAFKKELGGLDHAHARAEVQRQVRPAARALFADRAREPRRSQPARRPGEQPAPGALHARRWRRSRPANNVRFVDLFTPSGELYAKTAGRR